MTAIRKIPDIITNDMESHIFINISQYLAVATYSETEMQVFPKQLKQLMTVQYVITEKQ